MKTPLDLLEEVQQKPESTRKTIAAVLVIVFASIIVSIWFMNFSVPDSAPMDASQNQLSPFSLLWNFAKDSIGQVYKNK